MDDNVIFVWAEKQCLIEASPIFKDMFDVASPLVSLAQGCQDQPDSIFMPNPANELELLLDIAQSSSSQYAEFIDIAA